ncbi:hypothetical protein [Aeromicrobium sp. UC242_57]|uniref:hypothetical protein n=1 Tax=Aeromicrobium sp. UC242_57 TaxID=3374624 RepID=UPI0037B7CAE8
MMTRRVLLGTGAVVAGGAAALGAAQITHRLDDAARLVGLEPKPEPVPGDREIVRQAASDQAAVTATVEALDSAYPAWGLAPVAGICQQQPTPSAAARRAPTSRRCPPTSARRSACCDRRCAPPRGNGRLLLRSPTPPSSFGCSRRCRPGWPSANGR